MVYQFNQLRPSQTAEKEALLHKMFAEVGPQTHIEAPFHANWGGHDVHLGAHVYCNFNMTMVDDAPIYIGDDCMFGPNVVIATSGHPVLPVLRKHGYVYNFPVTIGNNVWVGAGVQILPGVTIGENTVIGAGSVVTHDIPANVVAFGSPCKVARPIGDKDKEYYFKNHRLDVSD
ncbi:galactoside O-acetyltransferase [Lactobacillus selangorensis]|uniref:Acetyltransferase n=1 Tax=Lactobacillus selangorensis TaxID=81857 RepID=A0A0R2FHL8_9LACO|nr:galactoside O-acetyltransferase [Lactobacillus selangorensis]KRN30994.1 galactoside O-acetyltransferase [Lactobacillus selangorensis]